ncbi:MAG: AmmeMemoRadiSam system protein B [candidate division NC10 bacterium]|nr:AmmeMemoRadiSam system protein B [candidate division NC10 bacterium]
MVRRPAVAGSFYPGVRDRLRFQVEALWPKVAQPERAVGVVVPHAGFVYSGRVAAAAYAKVEFPDSVVILGPNHSGLGARAALMTAGRWETPLGEVPLDTDLARAILASGAGIQDDPLGHLREHSIEVQLPFLQYFDRPFQFVPICLLGQDFSLCQEVGQAVARAIMAASKRVLLVASTDMSHYISRAEASRKDRMALEAILALEPAELHRVVREEKISMCGFHPTTAMLIAAKALGATRAELVVYTDSGEVTRTFDQVVAYAGLVVR